MNQRYLYTMMIPFFACMRIETIAKEFLGRVKDLWPAHDDMACYVFNFPDEEHRIEFIRAKNYFLRELDAHMPDMDEMEDFILHAQARVEAFSRSSRAV